MPIRTATRFASPVKPATDIRNVTEFKRARESPVADGKSCEMRGTTIVPGEQIDRSIPARVPRRTAPAFRSYTATSGSGGRAPALPARRREAALGTRGRRPMSLTRSMLRGRAGS